MAAGLSAIWVGLLLLCYFFLDRPFATFAHGHLREPFMAAIGLANFFRLTTLGVALVPQLAGLAVGAAILIILLWRNTEWGRICLAVAGAVVIAYLAKNELKVAFGRAWPDSLYRDMPSFVNAGLYGFYPFRRGLAYTSFPSGHMTVVTAPMAVLWWTKPRLRWLAIGLPGITALLLLGLNFHFISDCLAGAGLGAAIGSLAASLLALVRTR